MRAKKRKHGQISLEAISQTSPLLLLPPEIRESVWAIIYGSELSSHSPLQAKVHLGDSKPAISSGKRRERLFFEKSRCYRPFSHQSLLFTCRTTHKECWPLYISSHAFGFSRPIAFANNFLSYQPVHYLAKIRHLCFHAIDGSSLYNAASRSAVRGMILDLAKLFDHYPDVFDNLLSFTWELSDERSYAPEKGNTEAEMYGLIQKRLVKQLQDHRMQTGVSDRDEGLVTSPPAGDVAPLGWLLGIVSRVRKMCVGGTQSKLQDQSSMIFFERVAPQHLSLPVNKLSLRYVDLMKWFRELAPVPASYGGISVNAMNEARSVHQPVARSLYTSKIHFDPATIVHDPDLTTNLRSGVVLFSIRA